MQATREYPLPISPSVAWIALTDLKILKACIPGCESLSAISANEYAVTVSATLGPVRTSCRGTLELRRHDDGDPPAGYSLHFDGRAELIGRISGEVQVELQPGCDGGTRLRYAAKASIAGRLAMLGAPVVDMAAQDLAAKFFARLDDLLPMLPELLESTRCGSHDICTDATSTL
jgi:carbon monoxide dehydrogenase subunit G